VSRNQLELATCPASLLDFLVALRTGSDSMYSYFVSNGEFVVQLVEIILSPFSL